jgi:hypothetical protein
MTNTIIPRTADPDNSSLVGDASDSLRELFERTPREPWSSNSVNTWAPAATSAATNALTIATAPAIGASIHA